MGHCLGDPHRDHHLRLDPFVSSYAPTDLTGRIFDNEDKRNKRQPDFTGTANINGQIFRIVGWRNLPSERNKKANINLKFQDKHEFDLEQEQKRLNRASAQAANLADHHRPAPKQEDFDDDIPF